jgi:prepilin-type N-terminal cleavage/methylation domain-containing protein
MSLRVAEPAAPGREGFTLVEVVIAMLLASIVVVAVHAGTSLAADMAARRIRASAPVVYGHSARLALAGWLRSASPAAGAILAIDLREGDLELDELSVGLLDGGALHPGPARLRLFLNRGAEGGEILAVLASSHSGPGSRADTLVLMPAARSLSLRYRVRLAGRDQWVDAWTSEEVLPDAIEIRFVAGTLPEGLPDLPLLSLPFLLPLGPEGQ